MNVGLASVDVVYNRQLNLANILDVWGKFLKFEESPCLVS